MQSYVAEVSEIVRAQRRDEEEIDVLQERITWVVKELLGQRKWMQFYPYMKVFTKMVYYSSTTLAGVQTLGEEYVRIFETESTQAVPGLESRLVFVFLHAIAPILSQFALQRGERLLAHPSTTSFLGISLRHSQKARNSFLALFSWIRSTFIPQLHRIHVAFFYIFGIYYNMSRRASGIRFRSLSPQTNVEAMKLYKFLGFLTLAQTALALMLWVVSVVSKEANETANGLKKRTTATTTKAEALQGSDDFPHAWFQCCVCLERRSPSSTSCGHLFCWKCIQEHALSADAEAARCPHCRSPIEPSQVVPLLNL